MKRPYKIVLLTIITFLNFQVSAQIFQGYAVAGMNLSKVEGDRVNNNMLAFNKPGANMGLGVAVDLGHNFSTSMEVLFSQKGAYKKNGEPDSLKPAYLTRLNYAEIPVLIHYTDQEKYTFGTGLSYSRLVGLKWVVNGRTLSNNMNDNFFSHNNIDWIADFRMSLWKGLKFNFRYAYSLRTIWSGKEEDLLETIGGQKQDMNQRNSMVSFRLIWVFNEKTAKRHAGEIKNGE
jgi:hypothetical protein